MVVVFSVIVVVSFLVAQGWISSRLYIIFVFVKCRVCGRPGNRFSIVQIILRPLFSFSFVLKVAVI